MNEIRYYTDENISRAVINGLRQRGVDVLSVPEAGMLGASDEEQLTFALENKRVILPKMLISYGYLLLAKHMLVLSTVHNK